jgi:hypothetical protein
VTIWQLRGLAIPDSTITAAVDRGRLHPVFHGVYSVGHRYLTAHARLLAATMACGEGSVVSHGTAAWLLGLSKDRPEAVDVIAPVEAGRKISGIRRRFVPVPAGREVWRRGGVALTSPARTIVDCGGSDPKGVGGMIEQAVVSGLFDVRAIDRVLDGPRRKGTRHLLRVLEPWRRYRPGIKIRSRMEAKLLPLLSEAALPTRRPRPRAGRAGPGGGGVPLRMKLWAPARTRAAAPAARWLQAEGHGPADELPPPPASAERTCATGPTPRWPRSRGCSGSGAPDRSARRRPPRTAFLDRVVAGDRLAQAAADAAAADQAPEGEEEEEDAGEEDQGDAGDQAAEDEDRGDREVEGGEEGTRGAAAALATGESAARLISSGSASRAPLRAAAARRARSSAGSCSHRASQLASPGRRRLAR